MVKPKTRPPRIYKTKDKRFIKKNNKISTLTSSLKDDELLPYVINQIKINIPGRKSKKRINRKLKTLAEKIKTKPTPKVIEEAKVFSSALMPFFNQDQLLTSRKQVLDKELEVYKQIQEGKQVDSKKKTDIQENKLKLVEIKTDNQQNKLKLLEDKTDIVLKNILKLRNEQSEIKIDLDKYKNKIELAKLEVNKINNEIKKLSTNAKKNSDEIDELNEKKKEISENIIDYNRAYQQLIKEGNENKQKLKDEELQIKQRVDKNKLEEIELKNKLYATQYLYDDLLLEYEELQNEMQTVKNDIDFLKDERNRVSKLKPKNTDEIDAKNEELKRLDKGIELANENLIKLNKENSIASQKLEDLSNNTKILDDSILSKTTVNNDLTKQKRDIESQINRLNEENDRLEKTKITSKQQESAINLTKDAHKKQIKYMSDTLINIAKSLNLIDVEKEVNKQALIIDENMIKAIEQDDDTQFQQTVNMITQVVNNSLAMVKKGEDDSTALINSNLLKLTDINSQYDAMNKRIKELETKKEELESDLTNAQELTDKAIKEKQEAIGEIAGLLSNINNTKDELNQTKLTLDEQIKLNNEIIDKFKIDQDNLNNKLKQTNDLIETRDKEATELENIIEKSKNDINNLKQQLNDSEDEKKKLDQFIINAKEESDRLEQQINGLKKSEDAKKMDLESKQYEISKLIEEAEQKNKEIKDSEQKLIKQSQEIIKTNTNLLDAQKKIKETKQKTFDELNKLKDTLTKTLIQYPGDANLSKYRAPELNSIFRKLNPQIGLTQINNLTYDQLIAQIPLEYERLKKSITDRNDEKQLAKAYDITYKVGSEDYNKSIKEVRKAYNFINPEFKANKIITKISPDFDDFDVDVPDKPTSKEDNDQNISDIELDDFGEEDKPTSKEEKEAIKKLVANTSVFGEEDKQQQPLIKQQQPLINQKIPFKFSRNYNNLQKEADILKDKVDEEAKKNEYKDIGETDLRKQLQAKYDELGIMKKSESDEYFKNYDVWKNSYGFGKTSNNNSSYRMKDITSEDELEHYAKVLKLPDFLGVYTIDEISKIPFASKNFSFIFNTTKRNTQDVGHWIAVEISYDDGSLYYYDPLAEEPTKEFQEQIERLISRMDINIYLKFKINRIKAQELSSRCGWHCLNFLLQMADGIPWKDVTGYSNVRKKEKEAKLLKEKLGGYNYI